jgi:protein Tex
VREVTRAKGIVKSSVQRRQGQRRLEVQGLLRLQRTARHHSQPPHARHPPRRGRGELLWRIEAPVEEIVARLVREVVGAEAPRSS